MESLAVSLPAVAFERLRRINKRRAKEKSRKALISLPRKFRILKNRPHAFRRWGRTVLPKSENILDRGRSFRFSGHEVSLAVEVVLGQSAEPMVLFVVAVGAKEHEVVLIQRDVGIVDVLDGEMDFVMDLVPGLPTFLA